MNRKECDKLLVTKEELEEFNAIKDLPIIKEYCALLHKIVSQQEIKPELIFYKEANGKKYYIELPYKDIDIKDGKYYIRQNYYSYRYINENKKITALACLSLCKNSLDEIKRKIDERIEIETGDSNE